MQPVDIIRKKRDGHRLSDAEIGAFVTGASSDAWPDYQITALLMAIWVRGMDTAETVALTAAMVDSGVRLDLSAFRADGVVPVDKHSTGGVGDKTSLVVAPLAAACGAIVPMMSGRGLGHTGGTLDKLESIPGFRTALSLDDMRRALERTGCAMIGQTDDVAPADRKLYSLRDVTATVESLPLITASILSKKIAEGIGALVMDVKTGHGAFMKTLDDARALARAIVAIGNASGVRTEATITSMDAPLGAAVGNTLEVIEAIETLQGRGPRDVTDLSIALTSRMLVLAGVARDDADAGARVRGVLDSGAAFERLRDIVANQGGDPRSIDDPSRLPAAGHRHVITAQRSGFISELHAFSIGRASVLLGAGRERVDSVVDPAVGFIVRRFIGDAVKAGDVVLEVHYNDGARLARAEALAREAIEISDVPPPPARLVLDRIAEA